MGEKGNWKMIKWLLGMGYWVQGLRCFPWLAVIFYLKDSLKVDPSTLQILQNSAALPMVAKPLYGVVSDSFYFRAQHRLPYIALGAILQLLSWVAVAILASSSISVSILSFFLLLSNLGASIAEVANDAIVAEISKQPTFSKKGQSSSAGGLQSFVWMASSLGGVIGNLAGGVAIEKFSTRTIFLTFSSVLTVQLLITILVDERSLNLPKNQSSGGMKKQFAQLANALCKPDIAYSIGWLVASYAMVPVLTGTLFFYQTEALEIDSSVLGISKVFGQVGMLFWSYVYNKRLKTASPRKVISALQATMAVFMVSDVLFVNKLYQQMGVPDSVYVVVFSGLLEVLIFFKILPFSVLIAQLCPPGCEGSLMAFVMSAIALAMIVGGYFGVALASFVGVTGNDFSGLPRGLLIQAACTIIPLFWSSWIPDLIKPDVAKKE
ncbi:probable folate-biopterin transporter 7 [Beta vulgaris subsp. vulgaris]|uniref:probable folate-biopterin transporter 7 n=1 Tax=Beta vulgaris subsp. vulgaris TaxID=3555 RepID=UPI002036A797|nr:probable folate-biopterin transporter 7 [Beta vulgaris subsp. vulgaris]